MKFKVMEINVARAGLQEVLKAKLPTKVAFRLIRIARVLDDVLKDVESSRALIVDKFTQKDEDGNPVHPKDEKGAEQPEQVVLTDHKAYLEELTELLENEVDLEFDPIKEEDLSDIESVSGEALLKMFGVVIR
jgi:hypothetical protein